MCYSCLFLILNLYKMCIIKPGEKPEIQSDNETDNPFLNVS